MFGRGVQRTGGYPGTRTAELSTRDVNPRLLARNSLGPLRPVRLPHVGRLEPLRYIGVGVEDRLGEDLPQRRRMADVDPGRRYASNCPGTSVDGPHGCVQFGRCWLGAGGLSRSVIELR